MKNVPCYLTLVFKQPISDQVKQVFLNAEWSAVSHSHAIHDRDDYEARVKALEEELEYVKKVHEETIAEISVEIENYRAYSRQLKESQDKMKSLLKSFTEISVGDLK